MNSPILPDMSFLTYIRQDSVLSVQGSLRLSAEHCGSVLTTRKPEELPNRTYRNVLTLSFSAVAASTMWLSRAGNVFCGTDELHFNSICF